MDILIEMFDYYGVELRELLNGERKGEDMNKELEETVLKVAEYSNEDKLKVTRRMHLLFIGGMIAAIIYLILVFTDHTDNFWGGLCIDSVWNDDCGGDYDQQIYSQDQSV